MCSRVFAATFCESGASLSTIDTVETEKPQARAMSSSVTCPDFRWPTRIPPPVDLIQPGIFFIDTLANRTYSSLNTDSNVSINIIPEARDENWKIWKDVFSRQVMLSDPVALLFASILGPVRSWRDQWSCHGFLRRHHSRSFCNGEESRHRRAAHQQIHRIRAVFLYLTFSRTV